MSDGSDVVEGCPTGDGRDEDLPEFARVLPVCSGSIGGVVPGAPIDGQEDRDLAIQRVGR